ncbi:Pvc16 family protein [Amycolatopsis sp. NPDC049252]|uniref:Pvc16 family protein n=1 Tax=Amycolatopsis sp. NPDC049252 TaxID=3363933 RepID=UPI00371DAFA6
MIQHVDAAVTALIGSALPGEVDVRLDRPGAAPVSVFLHRVEEDVAARAASWTDELDERGRVVARSLPPRRYRFCYAVTASAEDTLVEHARLGAVLDTLAGLLHVPLEYLPPPLRSGPPIDLDVAHPALAGLPAELWAGFGVPPRTFLDVVLSVTLTPKVAAPLAAPPGEVDLGVRGGTPSPRPALDSEPPRHRIRE